jgi:hypothetical protein
MSLVRRFFVAQQQQQQQPITHINCFRSDVTSERSIFQNNGVAKKPLGENILIKTVNA